MTKRVAESRKKWLNDFARGLRMEFGLNEHESTHRAARLMDHIAEIRPADFYYWPSRSKQERDEAIAREFNGTNLKAVARKFGVSQASIYSIRSKTLAKRNAK